MHQVLGGRPGGAGEWAALQRAGQQLVGKGQHSAWHPQFEHLPGAAGVLCCAALGCRGRDISGPAGSWHCRPSLFPPPPAHPHPHPAFPCALGQGITRPKPAEYPPRDRRDRKGGKRSPPSAEAKAARGEGSRRRQAAAASPPGAAAAGPAAAAPGAAPAPGAAAAARTAALAKLAAAGKLPEAQQQAAEGGQQQQQPADGAPAEAGEVPSPTRRARAAAAVAPASPKAAAAPGAAPAAAPAARLGGPPDPEGARQALASGAVAVPTLGCGRCRQAPLGCRDCRKRQMKLWVSASWALASRGMGDGRLGCWRECYLLPAELPPCTEGKEQEPWEPCTSAAGLQLLFKFSKKRSPSACAR